MPSIQFKGKPSVETYHLTVPYRRLVPLADQSRSAKLSLDDNIIVHGDNLLALKALLPTFSGAIKCIYIDPPYNTGNEGWAYNDNVSSPMHAEWLHEVVGKEDLTRHDKWLCMIWPRLKLLRELLRDDGAIFVSMDDNEAHRLRMVMDEIFGEQNFVAQVVWQKRYAPPNDAKGIPEAHDYIVIYRKTEDFQRNLLPRTAENNALYKYDSNDGRGLWRPDNLSVRTYSVNYDYLITNPNTGIAYHPPRGRCWVSNEPTIQKWIDEERIFFGQDGRGAPQLKRYLFEVQQGTVPMTWWTHEEHGHNDESRKELKEIFDLDDLFATPKPTRLIRRILQIATDPDSIILDSFAGSGTTAQAVLAQNAEDGGNRRFILVEQEQYAETLTAERVRRVMAGVPSARDEALKAGYGGGFSFFRLGEPLDDEAMLRGDKLPAYHDLARYVFFTATGEQLDETQIDESRFYLGESRLYSVYMIYKPDQAFLRNVPLNLSWAQALGPAGDKPRLVIASHKYLDEHRLRAMQIEYCQLPFAIYRFQK